FHVTGVQTCALPIYATFDQMVGHFLAGRAHLGISLQSSDNPSLTSVALGSVPVVCIAPKGHDLQKLDIISPHDVTEFQWIGYPISEERRVGKLFGCG